MIIDDFFGTPIDDLVYRYENRITDIENSSDCNREYEFDIHLDKFEPNTPIDTKAIFIKGDKNTSILKAYITQNGLIVNLTGYTVTANIKEGANDVVTTPCVIKDVTGGLIEINLSDVYVDEYGENVFEIVLQKNDKIVVSQQYKYTVLDSLGEGNFGSETQLTALQSLIQQVQEKINKVDEKLSELKVTSQDIDEIMSMID